MPLPPEKKDDLSLLIYLLHYYHQLGCFEKTDKEILL